MGAILRAGPTPIAVPDAEPEKILTASAYRDDNTRGPADPGTSAIDLQWEEDIVPDHNRMI